MVKLTDILWPTHLVKTAKCLKLVIAPLFVPCFTSVVGPLVREGAGSCGTAEWRSIGLVFESSLKLEMFGVRHFVLFLFIGVSGKSALENGLSPSQVQQSSPRCWRAGSMSILRRGKSSSVYFVCLGVLSSWWLQSPPTLWRILCRMKGPDYVLWELLYYPGLRCWHTWPLALCATSHSAFLKLQDW